MEAYIQCLEQLLALAENQGYLTYDNVNDLTDDFDLSISQVDKISTAIHLRGIIMYESAPQPEPEPDDETLDDFSRTDYERVFAEIIALSENLTALVDEVRQIPPPQYKEAASLTVQAANGNSYAKERLVQLYIRNALSVALDMTKRYHLDIEDAISAGFTGLVAAVEKFDPNGFNKVQSFVRWGIQHTIERECRPVWQDYYFPANLGYSIMRVYQCFEELAGSDNWEELSNDMLISTIAQKLEETEENVVRYLKLARIQKSRISYEQLKRKCEKAHGCYYGALVLSDEPFWDDVYNRDMRDVMENALATLTPRQANVLKLRFGFYDGNPHTLEEVGQMMQVTRERIRQIEAKALMKLKHPSRSKRLKDHY